MTNQLGDSLQIKLSGRIQSIQRSRDSTREFSQIPLFFPLKSTQTGDDSCYKLASTASVIGHQGREKAEKKDIRSQHLRIPS